MKRTIPRWLALLTLAGTCAFGAAKPPSTRPNIVFILIDDMGWTDGGCFGSKFYQTPHIDALASSAMRFTQAYAACAVCSPTRAALMTGKYPARLHITDWIPGEDARKNSRFHLPAWQQHLPLEETTLATALKNLGYTTAHIGKWHLGSGEFLPQHQGFDTNIAGGDIGSPASYFWPYGAAQNSHHVPGLSERGGQTGEYLTDQLTDEALQFIEANRDRPFYLNLAHYAVHNPLQGKPALIELADERPGANGQSNAVYAAMLRSVDDSVGRIAKKLDELRLAKRTLIVFTSDNGGAVHIGKPPATSNSPLRNGKGSAYEGGLLVPLLVKLPGVTRAGSVCNTPVITMDFFPTLLELAGADKSASRSAVDGVSFVPLLRGEKQPQPHGEFFWHYPHYWNGGKVSPYSVARIGDWKLIRFYETGREELYDLNSDLSEKNDLAGANPKKRQELHTRLEAWLSEVGAQMPVPKSPEADESCDQPSPEEMAKAVGVTLPHQPWHVANIWWDFEKPTEHFSSLEMDVTIDRDVPSTYNLYVSPCGIARINGQDFYGGLQSNINGWQNATNHERIHPGRGAIFSRWSADKKTPVGLENVRVAGPDCLIESAGYEGAFGSVRRPFAWTKGAYTYRIEKGPTEIADGKTNTWFACTVKSSDGSVREIGSLRFEGEEFTFWARHSAFVEVYSTAKIPHSNIPKVNISFGWPRLNGQKAPLKRASAYYPHKTGEPAAPDCAWIKADGENVRVEVGAIFVRDEAQRRHELKLQPVKN